jgi:hypothetical protein
MDFCLISHVVHCFEFNYSEMDGYEFTIVSLDGHQWFFEASTSEVSEAFILTAPHVVNDLIEGIV